MAQVSMKDLTRHLCRLSYQKRWEIASQFEAGINTALHQNTHESNQGHLMIMHASKAKVKWFSSINCVATPPYIYNHLATSAAMVTTTLTAPTLAILHLYQPIATQPRHHMPSKKAAHHFLVRTNAPKTHRMGNTSILQKDCQAFAALICNAHSSLHACLNNMPPTMNVSFYLDSTHPFVQISKYWLKTIISRKKSELKTPTLRCGPLSWGDGLPTPPCGPLSWG